VGTSPFEPSKSKSQFQKEYDDLAFLYDKARAVRTERAIAPLVLKWLPAARDRALDIGCGTGQLVSHLATQFASVVGADYSSGMLREARRLNSGARGVSLVSMDAEKLGFGDSTFDFVVAASLLHHVRPEIALREAARVLRPGGRLFIVEGVGAERSQIASKPRRRHIIEWLRAVRHWARLTRRLGAANAFRWSRRWGRHTSGERRLTVPEWNALAAGIPGCETGVFHSYSYLVWNRPPMN
jgi:ubiquinone/menaquinone biosynthesis C-methylase UbiE